MELQAIITLINNIALDFKDWEIIALSFWPYIVVFIIISLLTYACYCAREGGIHYVATERVPIVMRKVKNPFTFELNQQNTYSPGVECVISTQRNCSVLPFWGAPAYDLFQLLKMNLGIIKDNLMENHTFKNKCLASGPILRLNSGQQVCSIVPPSSLYQDERINQGAFLPLVIVMLLDENSIENIEHPFVFIQVAVINVPAMFKNVNMRKEHNRSPRNAYAQTQQMSSVLGIYIKESHASTIGVVKRIYDGSMYSENLNGEDLPVCVACCQRTVNTVIYPCLHASLCSLCYLQCETCPSCRGPIFYYFTTGPFTQIPQEGNEN